MNCEDCGRILNPILSKCVCKNTETRKSPSTPCSDKIDYFHLHEIVDRCHIINSMIDDFLIGHTAMDEITNKLCEEAQAKISEVMNIVSSQ